MQPPVPVMNLGPGYRFVTEIASGGMGSVLLAVRTERTGRHAVALKQLHGHLADDHDAVAGLVDEARIASRIVHPNVVHVLDVEMSGDAIFLVMDYIEGISLSALLRALRARGEEMALPVVRRILVDALTGLHAAHELRDANGKLLGVVHRDVSPQNVLVGADGIARMTDFGIALSVGRLAFTQADGKVKGKLPYLSPEQVYRKPIDRRADVFAAGCVAWECIVGKGLFHGATEGETLAMVVREPISPPSTFRFDVPTTLDEVCLRALERDPARRYATAAELARGIEADGDLATRDDVRDLVTREIGATLAERRERLAEVMAGKGGTASSATTPSRDRAPSLAPTESGTAPDVPSPSSVPRTSRALILAAALLLLGSLAGGGVVWLIARPRADARAAAAALASGPLPTSSVVVGVAQASGEAAPSSELADEATFELGGAASPSTTATAPSSSSSGTVVRKGLRRPSGAHDPRDGRDAHDRAARASDASAPRPFMPDRL